MITQEQFDATIVASADRVMDAIDDVDDVIDAMFILAIAANRVLNELPPEPRHALATHWLDMMVRAVRRDIELTGDS